MASPDMSRYVDLTVFDLQPIEIYDAAVEYAKTALPEWEPVPASIEDALLQAASSMTGQLLGAINRLPSSLVEGLLRLYGIERSSGSRPTATVTFTTIGDTGYTIPSGTRVGYLDETGDEPVLFLFETTQAAILSIGQTTINVSAVGVEFQRYPSLVAGEPLQLLSALSFIDTVTLTADIVPGANAETSEEFLNRAVNIFGSLSESLTLASQVDRYTLANYPSIYRVKTYSRVRSDRAIQSLARVDNVVTATLSASCTIEATDVIRVFGADNDFNGIFTVTGTTPTTVYWSQTGDNASASVPGSLHSIRFQDDFIDEETLEYTPQNGYSSVYVSGIGGASVSDLTLSTLQEDLSDRTVAGLIVQIGLARPAEVGVEIEIYKQNSVAISTVVEAVETAMNNYLHPDHWAWDDKIYVNELIALVDGVSGVVRVKSITLDDTLSDFVELDEDGNIKFLYYGILPTNNTSVTVVS